MLRVRLRMAGMSMPSSGGDAERQRQRREPGGEQRAGGGASGGELACQVPAASIAARQLQQRPTPRLSGAFPTFKQRSLVLE